MARAKYHLHSYPEDFHLQQAYLEKKSGNAQVGKLAHVKSQQLQEVLRAVRRAMLQTFLPTMLKAWETPLTCSWQAGSVLADEQRQMSIHAE